MDYFLFWEASLNADYLEDSCSIFLFTKSLPSCTLQKFTMSPLKTSQKIGYARLYMRKYFPGISEEIIQRVTDLALPNFIGNYSPRKREQESPYAAGCGQTYEEFIIDLGRGVSGREPQGINRDQLHDILIKGTM